VKLFQKFTHPDMYLARDGVTSWDLSRADVDLFSDGRRSTGVSGAARRGARAVSAELSRLPETREYLDWLLPSLAGYPLAVELRHHTWSDDTAGTASMPRRAWRLLGADR